MRLPVSVETQFGSLQSQPAPRGDYRPFRGLTTIARQFSHMTQSRAATARDPADEFPIALGVSRKVSEYRRKGSRVQFKDSDRWLIAEGLILRRWRRKRTRPGAVFRGVRLQPGTWRAVILCLARAGRVDWASPTAIRAALERLPRKDIDGNPIGAPTRGMLVLALQHLSKRGVLEPLLRRHEFSVERRSPGIPDLFLCRVEADGRITGARFVEVKRWNEQVLDSQIAELRFLRAHGLKAGIVRLLRPPKEADGKTAVGHALQRGVATSASASPTRTTARR